jgi:hypothetical protein
MIALLFILFAVTPLFAQEPVSCTAQWMCTSVSVDYNYGILSHSITNNQSKCRVLMEHVNVIPILDSTEMLQVCLSAIVIHPRL